MNILSNENICIKCGRCCLLHSPEIETSIRCFNLDDNNLCKKYMNRPEWCMTAEEMYNNNLLPEGCPYLEDE